MTRWLRLSHHTRRSSVAPIALCYLLHELTNLMKLRATFLVVSFLLSCTQARAQTLVYSLCYSETQTSRQIRFPNGIFGASPKDKLAMLRNCRKNEVYAASMADGKRTLVFSDETLDVEIRPTGPVLGTDKAYGIGVLREWRSAPTPGAYAEPDALYEISLDGSNRVRRLLEIGSDQRMGIFLNAQGTRAATTGFTGQKYVVSVYGVPTWHLLRTWELSKVIEAHCPDCSLVTWGWLGDGARLFFDITVAGDDEGALDKPGTYVVAEDGTDLGKVAPARGTFEDAGAVHPNFIDGSLIAQTPDGDYVFEDYVEARQLRAHPQSFLIVSGPKLHKAFAERSRATSFRLSPTGRYLAYVEERQMPTYQTDRHLWGRDLQSGEEKELFVVPPSRPPTSPEPNVALTVLGWTNN